MPAVRRTPSDSRTPTPGRVFLQLTTYTALALAIAVRNIWAMGPRQRRMAERVQAERDIALLDARIQLLLARFQRFRRRPRYTAREKLLVLEYADRFGLGPAALAREFLASAATIHRWKTHRNAIAAQVTAPPPKKPMPSTRTCDADRAVILQMAREGYEHDRTIARHLHAMGHAVHAGTVAHIRRGTVPKARRKRGQKDTEVLPQSTLLARLRGARWSRLWGPTRLIASALTEGLAIRAHEDENDLPLAPAYRLHSRRVAQIAILRSRMARVPPRERTHYTPAERAEILTLKHRYNLSNRALAAWLLIDPATLSDWNHDVDAPKVPARVKALDDLDAAVAAAKSTMGRIPKRLMAAVDAAITTLAARTRVRRQRPRHERNEGASTASTRRWTPKEPIRPYRPNHWWGIDVTHMPGLGYKLIAVVDLFSRHLLAWDLFRQEPSREDAAGIFNRAVAQFGAPAQLVSDKGEQFHGGAFTAALAAAGTGRRVGAVGQHGSIAIVERTWRTIKDSLDLDHVRPIVPETLYSRIACVVDYYATKRPHMTLGDTTPSARYHGDPEAPATATRLRRGLPGQMFPRLPIQIRHALPGNKLPYLVRIA